MNRPRVGRSDRAVLRFASASRTRAAAGSPLTPATGRPPSAARKRSCPGSPSHCRHHLASGTDSRGSVHVGHPSRPGTSNSARTTSPSSSDSPVTSNKHPLKTDVAFPPTAGCEPHLPELGRRHRGVGQHSTKACAPASQPPSPRAVHDLRGACDRLSRTPRTASRTGRTQGRSV